MYVFVAHFNAKKCVFYTFFPGFIFHANFNDFLFELVSANHH